MKKKVLEILPNARCHLHESWFSTQDIYSVFNDDKRITTGAHISAQEAWKEAYKRLNPHRTNY